MTHTRETHLNILVRNRFYRESLVNFINSQEGLNVSQHSDFFNISPQSISKTRVDVFVFDSKIDTILPYVYQIKNIRSEIKFVIILNTPNDILIDEYVAAGVQGFISAQDGVSAFPECINEVIAGRLFYPSEVTQKIIQKLTQPTRLVSQKGGFTINLTPRQNSVIQLLESGCSNKEIARNLGIELATVKNHVHQILERLNVKSRNEAVALYRRVKDCQQPPIH